jgi:hypothetical protein
MHTPTVCARNKLPASRFLHPCSPLSACPKARYSPDRAVVGSLQKTARKHASPGRLMVPVASEGAHHCKKRLLPSWPVTRIGMTEAQAVTFCFWDMPLGQQDRPLLQSRAGVLAGVCIRRDQKRVPLAHVADEDYNHEPFGGSRLEPAGFLAYGRVDDTQKFLCEGPHSGCLHVSDSDQRNVG